MALNQISFKYDAAVDAAYIKFEDKAGKYDVSYEAEVPENVKASINLDFSIDGQLLGVEILGASKVLPRALLSRQSK